MSESSSPALGPNTHESPWGKSSGLSKHRFPDALSEAGQLGSLKGSKTCQEPTELTLCPTVAVYHTRMNTHAYSPTCTLSHTHIYSQTHPITRYLKHTLTPYYTRSHILPHDAITYSYVCNCPTAWNVLCCQGLWQVAQVTTWHHTFCATSQRRQHILAQGTHRSRSQTDAHLTLEPTTYSL